MEDFMDISLCKNCLYYDSETSHCELRNEPTKPNIHCTFFKNVELEDLYKKYKEWLHIEDFDRIDVVLAAALSRKYKGTKIWLIIIGQSGDWKSLQLEALNHEEFSKDIPQFTANTLVNGFKNKKIFPDLAPKLKDKILLLPEFAGILTLTPQEKAQVWAQLRLLFDGKAGKASGMGMEVVYNNLNVTLIAGSTPAIDGQILIHQSLGTRELVWRPKETDNEKLMDKLFENLFYKEKIMKELREITYKYLNIKEIKEIEIPIEIRKKLKKLCEYLCIMRAAADIDYTSGELTNIVYPEKPTRILEQLSILYLCLKSLSDDYSDEKAMNIIQHIVESSCFQTRCGVFRYLKDNPNIEVTRQMVADYLKIGYKTAYKELNILCNLDIVINRTEEIVSNSGFKQYNHYYSINNHHKLTKMNGGLTKISEDLTKMNEEEVK